MQKVVLVVHDVRSALNVGSILRTAEGLGVYKVILSGYTPYPEEPADNRLPHLRQKQSSQIHKTALGAEDCVTWQHSEDAQRTIKHLLEAGYTIAALEQTPKAVKLSDFDSRQKVALLVGNEVSGLDKDILKLAHVHLQIPMQGRKESFNVAVAAAIALYHLKYWT